MANYSVVFVYDGNQECPITVQNVDSESEAKEEAKEKFERSHHNVTNYRIKSVRKL